eukprot:g3283.t1
MTVHPKDGVMCLVGLAIFSCLCAMMGSWTESSEWPSGDCIVQYTENIWGRACIRYLDCPDAGESGCSRTPQSELSPVMKAVGSFTTLMLIFSCLGLFVPVAKPDVPTVALAALWFGATISGIISMSVYVDHVENYKQYGWGFAFNIVGWMVSFLIAVLYVVIGDDKF